MWCLSRNPPECEARSDRQSAPHSCPNTEGCCLNTLTWSPRCPAWSALPALLTPQTKAPKGPTAVLWACDSSHRASSLLSAGLAETELGPGRVNGLPELRKSTGGRVGPLRCIFRLFHLDGSLRGTRSRPFTLCHMGESAGSLHTRPGLTHSVVWSQGSKARLAVVFWEDVSGPWSASARPTCWILFFVDCVGEVVRAVGGEGVSVDGPGAQYCPFRSGSEWPQTTRSGS